jgi:Protein of unknown function (DUF3224)
MTTHANATFTIKTWEENAILETDGGSKITRATVSRLFEGDLEGEGNVEWLMAYDGNGSAVCVGLERVVGKLAGRSGSFVLQQVGSFDGQVAKAESTVVPGSGAGELTGLRGTGSFEAGLGADGKRAITLNCDL